MAFLGVLEAVRHRLEGNRRDTVPDLRRLLDQWDRQSPSVLAGVQGQATVDAFMRRASHTRVGRIKVPIHFFDGGGQNFKAVYPSLTYDIIGGQPRFDEGAVYMPPEHDGDWAWEPVDASVTTIRDEDGEELGTAASIIRQKPVAHPYDVHVELRAYAKDPILMALLERYVYAAFAPRDFLRVPMQDGSHRSWDVIFQDANDLDKREAVRSGTPGVEREYAKAWTYKVEAFFDNTDMARLVNLVEKRIITLSSTT